MELHVVLPLISITLAEIAAIPQVLRLRKKKSAEDISFLYQLIVWINAWIMLVHFIIVWDIVGIYCNAACIILVGLILAHIIYYRWKAGTLLCR
jgi:uncharacterized protein with PQ loop repeat